MTNKMLFISFNKYKLINMFFDISLLLYFIAYFVYYKDIPGASTIRLLSTASVLLFGMMLSLNNARRALKLGKFEIWLAVFIIFGFISILWAPSSSAVMGVLVNLIRIFLVAYFIRVRVQNADDLNRVLVLYVVATLYMVIFILLKMMDMYTFEQILVRRFGDQFEYNSNQTAVQCCFSIMILLYLTKERKHKFIYLGLMVFFAFILLLTQSKKGIVCLAIGLVSLYYNSVRGNKKVGRIIIAVLGIILSYVLITNIPFFYNLIGHRLEEMMNFLLGFTASMGEDARRFQLWDKALETWFSSPIFGVGLANFSIVNFGVKGAYAHNNYLELLADVGFIGTIIYYCLPVSILLTRFKSSDNLQVLLHTFVLILLIMDIGVVSYSNISMVLFYALSLISIGNSCNRVNKTNINRVKSTRRLNEI